MCTPVHAEQEFGRQLTWARPHPADKGLDMSRAWKRNFAATNTKCNIDPRPQQAGSCVAADPQAKRKIPLDVCVGVPATAAGFQTRG